MCELEYRNTALACPKEKQISINQINFNKLLSLLKEKEILTAEETLKLLS